MGPSSWAALIRPRAAAYLALAVGLAALAGILVLWATGGAAAAARFPLTKVGLVTQVGGLNDLTYNWLSHQGLLRAESELGVVGTVYEPTSDADYAPYLQQCADDGNSLCLSVSFLMMDATWAIAENNPNTHFATVDAEWSETPANLRGLAFAEEEAAYLAGTLAGLMTSSDVLADIGGMPIPPVQRFVYGFRNGARCANPDARVLITYTWDFANPVLGAQVAQALIDRGADTVFAPAGGSGSGAILWAAQAGAWAVGVDVDQYLSVFENGAVPGHDRLLTSAMKRLDTAVYDTIADEVSHAFTPGTVRYDLAAGGVGLAPYHAADPAIPQAVKDSLVQVEDDIVSGAVDVNDPCWTSTRYVDGAGSDTGDCTNPAAPCQTVQYAVLQAEAGDSVAIAGGTYVENVWVDRPLMLLGGYSGPPDWTRDLGAHETVLDGSGSATVPGDWDEGVRYPTVLPDGTAYKMWYTGYDLFGTARIGLATSPDGLAWTKHTGPVLDVGATGEWDAQGVEAVAVLKEGSAYKMWYSGYGWGRCGVGYATSPDGSTWTKYTDNPVIATGTDGWNDNCVQHPTLLYQEGVYKMWLMTIGDGGDGLAPHVAYATSTDGLQWDWAATNPVVSRSWEGWLWDPEVLYQGNNYLLWHSVWYDGQARIAFAKGEDEVDLIKHPTPVLSGGTGEWDDGFAADPSLYYDGSRLVLYYDNNKAIGRATSEDGLDWAKWPANPVLEPGAQTQYGAPVVSFADQAGGSVLDGLTLKGGDALGGGGVRAGNAHVTLRRCTVRDNQGYGPGAGGGVGGGNPLVVEDSLMLDNRIVSAAPPGGTGGGGGVATSNALFLTNVVLAGNQGDAAVHAKGDVTLMNVTVAGNAADLLWDPGDPAALSMVNSILYANASRTFEVCPAGSACSITYSDLQGGWPGEGNLDADPRFVGAGDYRLRGGSPCIDAGTAEGAPGADVEGTPRDARPDIGAYEWHGERLFLPVVVRPQ